MMCELKRSLRLLGYSFQFGANVALAAVIEVVGLIVMGLMMYFAADSPAEIYTSNSMLFVSGMMLLQLAPLMLSQMAISLECSGIILSSRLHKAVGVSLPGFIGIVDAVQTLLILVALAFICKNVTVLGGLIFVAGIVFFIVLLYMTLAFRYFIVGMVLYLVGYVGVTILATYVFQDMTEGALLNGKTGLALGILAMALGVAVSYAMRHYLYKKPIAKISVSKKLRQYL